MRLPAPYISESGWLGFFVSFPYFPVTSATNRSAACHLSPLPFYHFIHCHLKFSPSELKRSLSTPLQTLPTTPPTTDPPTYPRVRRMSNAYGSWSSSTSKDDQRQYVSGGSSTGSAGSSRRSGSGEHSQAFAYADSYLQVCSPPTVHWL